MQNATKCNADVGINLNKIVFIQFSLQYLLGREISDSVITGMKFCFFTTVSLLTTIDSISKSYPINKLTSVFYASVLLLIMNCIITLLK